MKKTSNPKTSNPLCRAGATAALACLTTLSLAGCGSLSERERDTAVGAALGGAAGNVITGGSTAGTLGGAAVGGYIGNQRSR